jgi:peptide/nickel transport system substrate-binding protein
MLSNRRGMVLLAALAAAAIVASACAGGPATGDVYKIAILADMTTTNLWNLLAPGSSAYNFVVQLQYYPALFEQSDVRFAIVPSVAADFASPLTEEDGMWVCTVDMKNDVTWSDGSTITADDVAFTVNLVLDFRLGGNWQGSYDWDFLDHVEAVDADTVKFYYHTKPGLAVHDYGALQGVIASKAFWEPKVGDAVAVLEDADLSGLEPGSDEYLAALTPAHEALYAIDATGEPTAGPFMFKEWETGAYSENDKNDEYYFEGRVVQQYVNGAHREFVEGVYDLTAYGDASGDIELEYTTGPFFNSVNYSVYDQDAAVLALLNGDVDYVYNPSGWGPGIQAQLRANADVGTTTNPQNGFRFAAFNFDTPLFADRAVRQALECMIDKDFLSQNILQGAVLPVYSPVPPEVTFWYNADVTRFCEGFDARQRMEWAVEHLKDAGYRWDTEPTWNEERGGSVDWGVGLKYPDGEYVEDDLVLLAPSAGYDPLRASAGVFIEQWANQLGIPIEANLTNFNNLLNESLGGGGNFDMLIMGWGLGDMFPDHLCVFFESDAQPFQFMNYNNRQLDNLCDDFLGETDMNQAREYALQLQEILATDLPYIYVFTNPIVDAYRADTIEYPFSTLLDGIQGEYGLQSVVYAAE